MASFIATGTGSSRLQVLRFFLYLLIFLDCTDMSTWSCFGFVHRIYTSKKSPYQQPSYEKEFTSASNKMHMSSSLDDAALLGKIVFQAIIDASPIGLPIAGLVAAFVLSKSSIQHREDLRTEIEVVQKNIIQKSEEAAVAGNASKTLLMISVFSTLLSIGNVVTMIPTTEEKFESSTNQVIEQIVIAPTSMSTNQNSIELNESPVTYETLPTQSTSNAELSTSKANSEISTMTHVMTEDSKKELLDDFAATTTPDIDITLPSRILDEVEEVNKVIQNTEMDLSEKGIDAPTSSTQQISDLKLSTVAGLLTQEVTETSKDPLLAALNQYKTQGSTKIMSKEFVSKAIEMMNVLLQSAAVTLSSDPTMMSVTHFMKDSASTFEISIQILTDRLPSESQPFMKGFLVGTLLLNIFNEGQRYKDEVYTIHSDEKMDTRIDLNNETNITKLETQLINNEMDYVRTQPWNNFDGIEVPVDDRLKAADDEKESIMGEVQALAEVLISKRIVKELLQKKKANQKPYFASSSIAIADQQNIPLPQPPIETPSMELFDADTRVLVERLKRESDGYSNVFVSPAAQLRTGKFFSPRWTASFLRKSPKTSKVEKYSAKKTAKNTNALALWMKNMAASWKEISTEKASGETSEVSSLLNSSTLQPPQRDAWTNPPTSIDIDDDFSVEYKFMSPLKVERIFDSNKPLYGTSPVRDEASGSVETTVDYSEKEDDSILLPTNAKLDAESFRRYNIPPMIVKSGQEGSGQLESKKVKPIFPNAAKSGPQYSPLTNRTQYSSIGEASGGKEVGFNAPSYTDEHQYSRNSGSMQGNINASMTTTEPPKIELTSPFDYKDSLSPSNISSNEATANLKPGEIDMAQVPIQPEFGKSSYYEYTEGLPSSNNVIEEPRKFEFPTPSNYEPTFSALSIYGEPLKESLPELDSNRGTKFQTQEFVQPFSALNIYSVAPESNDVNSASISEKLSTSVETQPISNLSEASYNDPVTRNQEYTAAETTEPSFDLADLFNETSASQEESESNSELQEALSIPVADILPPSFKVDLEAANSLYTTPFDNIDMFSILPDGNDIFSAKPSFNPYPTRKPDTSKLNDLQRDAIDTKIDPNPTYYDQSDALFVLPQELSIPRKSEVYPPEMSESIQFVDTQIVDEAKSDQSGINDMKIKALPMNLKEEVANSTYFEASSAANIDLKDIIINITTSVEYNATIQNNSTLLRPKEKKEQNVISQSNDDLNWEDEPFQ